MMLRSELVISRFGEARAGRSLLILFAALSGCLPSQSALAGVVVLEANHGTAWESKAARSLPLDPARTENLTLEIVDLETGAVVERSVVGSHVRFEFPGLQPAREYQAKVRGGALRSRVFRGDEETGLLLPYNEFGFAPRWRVGIHGGGGVAGVFINDFSGLKLDDELLDSSWKVGARILSPENRSLNIPIRFLVDVGVRSLPRKSRSGVVMESDGSSEIRSEYNYEWEATPLAIEVGLGAQFEIALGSTVARISPILRYQLVNEDFEYEFDSELSRDNSPDPPLQGRSRGSGERSITHMFGAALEIEVPMARWARVEVAGFIEGYWLIWAGDDASKEVDNDFDVGDGLELLDPPGLRITDSLVELEQNYGATLGVRVYFDL